MRCKLFTDWCYAYLLTFFIIIFLIYAFLFLVLSEQTIPFLKTLASYDLNTIIIGTITIIIAIIALCVELKKSFERKVENQIKLIDGLIAEIDILSAERSEIYGNEKPTKGNLVWYKEEITKNPLVLDHIVHKIRFDKYIAEFDKSICKIMDISKLFRTLSYLNNKFDEINYIQKIRDKILDELNIELKKQKVVDIEDSKNKIMKKNLEVYGKIGVLNNIYDIIEESITICHKTKNELIKQRDKLLFWL